MGSLEGGGRVLHHLVYRAIAGAAYCLLQPLIPGGVPGTQAAETPPFQAVFPARLSPGAPLKIHVTFAHRPPDKTFYRLQVNIDGQPVAMADMWDEKSSWITVGTPGPGPHKAQVLWRNPRSGSPVSRSGIVTVGREPLPSTDSLQNHPSQPEKDPP